MAALAMDHGREPEVARFIDTYKYDQESASKRNKFGGGTSLPLNSDGYEDKQRQLKEERHADWLRQQEKGLNEPHPLKNPLAPITFGPQSAADYEQEIQKMTDRYHNKYNEQREAERQKFEARRQSPQRAPQPPGAPQVDYDRNSEVAKSEDRKAYQDYMGKYQYSQSAPIKPPINYEENRKVLSEERKREYNDLIEKKAKEERYWAMRGRPVTPAGGLNIGNYDRQLKETAPQKKKEYKEMLDQQQREHMYLRARQEPEVSVMDRSGPPAQYVPTKPPPGPGYRPRDENEERRRQEEARHNTGKPAEVVRNPYYSSDDYESWRRKEQAKLGDEYKEFLKQTEEKRSMTKRLDDPLGAPKTTYEASYAGMNPPPSPKRMYHQKPPSPYRSRVDAADYSPMHRPPPSPLNGQARARTLPPLGLPQQQQDQFSPPQQYYQDQLPPPPRAQNMPMPGGSMGLYQNDDYDDDAGQYQPKMGNLEEADPHRFHQSMTAAYPKANSAPPGSLPATPSKLSLPLGQYDDMRPFIEKQRNKEYNSLKDKIGPSPRRLAKTPTDTATSLNVGQYDTLKPKFEAQRNQEYQEYLKTLPPVKKTGVIPRSTAVTLPVGQYEQVKNLIEKQRNQEYNELVQNGKIGKRTFREKIPTPPQLQGLPLGQYMYEPLHKAMETQRNREYNDFIQKKYGNAATQRTTRSEPAGDTGNPTASFYYGNEGVQAEKRKHLEEERRNEYNQLVREMDPPLSKSFNVPTDTESGLPIGQQHHEAWRKFLREQRNREYNQLVDVKGQEHRNREWNFEQGGVLELRGDDAVQSKQRELRAERQKDYENYKNQQKVTNPQRRHDLGDTAAGPFNGGLFQGLGEHGNDKEGLNQQRRQEYNDKLDQNVDRGRSPQRVPPPTDQYSKLLEEKRREEASRRRYDDPEFQGRLPQSRERYGY